MGIESLGGIGGAKGIGGPLQAPPESGSGTPFKVDWKELVFTVDPEAKRLADVGYEHIKARDYPAAVLALNDSLKVQDNPIARNRRSVAKTHLGDFAGAKADFTRALELEPGYPNALYNLATQRVREGRFDEALDIFAEHVFSKGQGFIDGAKGDGDLDGLRAPGNRISTKDYNFPLQDASPAQMQRFAQLTGDAPRASVVEAGDRPFEPGTAAAKSGSPAFIFTPFDFPPPHFELELPPGLELSTLRLAPGGASATRFAVTDARGNQANVRLDNRTDDLAHVTWQVGGEQGIEQPFTPEMARQIASGQSDMLQRSDPEAASAFREHWSPFVATFSTGRTPSNWC